MTESNSNLSICFKNDCATAREIRNDSEIGAEITQDAFDAIAIIDSVIYTDMNFLGQLIAETFNEIRRERTIIKEKREQEYDPN
jgi:protein tyrosine/serine phosphatase